MRIVVTGMGLVSPYGAGVGPFWSAICRGESGIRPITRFDASGFLFSRAGEVPAREPRAAAGEAVDIASRFLLDAADEALRDAGLASNPLGPQAGVVASTNFGGAVSGEELLAEVAGRGRSRASSFAEYGFQRATDHVARAWGAGGPRLTLSLSCASGTAALDHGAALIRAGGARVVLAAGYDALSRFAWSGLSALRTMTADEVRPFDRRRNGTIFSEGAGVLVIEDADWAVARGARIHAELLGSATNNNAFHMTAPAKEGAGSAAVMRAALRDAGIRPERIDHINAHGTGTKPNDVTETQAIRSVFGSHAGRMPITSIKSSVGHLMGAAGTAEAIASILSIRDGVIPPTTNFGEPDPECDLDCVANVKRAAPVRTVLSNSAGIGGCNAAVIFGAW